MKRIRQRRLSLDFATPANPVPYEKGKQLFAKMKETLARQFAACGKISSK